MQTTKKSGLGFISDLADKLKNPKKAEPKRKPRMKKTEAIFNFQVDRELKDEFLRLAKENNETAAGLLRKYINNYIKEVKHA